MTQLPEIVGALYTTLVKLTLIAILSLAVILRIANLSSGDIVGNDEVFYAFRSIGLLDFNNSQQQPTPLEWQDPNMEWWTKFSFHDHPPLVFLIQHLFIKIFGENTFAFRLPSAIFGVLSVYILYLIGRRLFSENVGLLAAASLAVTVNHVYISRIGLQESYAIFFMLLATHFFLKSLTNAGGMRANTENSSAFIWTGVALGLGFLTKYNTFIMVPIFLVYLLIYRRDVFKNLKFWLGALIALVIFSPVIIYNIAMYRSVGHFDFQFSYIFGQHPEIWKVAVGKEQVGDFINRLRSFAPNLVASHSWLFLAVFAASLILLARHYKKSALVIIILLFIATLLLMIGPTFRFLTMLTPYLGLSVGFLLSNLLARFPGFSQKRTLVYLGLGAFLLVEAMYSINSAVTNHPIGPKLFAFSQLRYDNYNWGYNELDNYLDKELKNKMPALTFRLRYKFLSQLQEAALEENRRQNLDPHPILIVYDGNINTMGQLWIFGRREIYHAWPTINAEAYLNMPKKPAAERIYFIMPTDKVLLKKGRITNAGEIMERQLVSSGLVPLLIFNKRGEAAFRVYIWQN